jgi:hypothetical protein
MSPALPRSCGNFQRIFESQCRDLQQQLNDDGHPFFERQGHEHSPTLDAERSCARALDITEPRQPCAADIDRMWVEVGTKLQARLGAGRSAPQTIIALMRRQPTPNSVATAEQSLGQRWLPMETTVAALARARQADRANDSFACEQAITEAQRAIVPTDVRSSDIRVP